MTAPRTACRISSIVALPSVRASPTCVAIAPPSPLTRLTIRRGSWPVLSAVLAAASLEQRRAERDATGIADALEKPLGAVARRRCAAALAGLAPHVGRREPRPRRKVPVHVALPDVGS